jgi:hypothetical protein
MRYRLTIVVEDEAPARGGAFATLDEVLDHVKGWLTTNHFETVSLSVEVLNDDQDGGG